MSQQGANPSNLRCNLGLGHKHLQGGKCWAEGLQDISALSLLISLWECTSYTIAQTANSHLSDLQVLISAKAMGWSKKKKKNCMKQRKCSIQNVQIQRTAEQTTSEESDKSTLSEQSWFMARDTHMLCSFALMDSVFFVESVARWQSHQSKVWCWWNIDDLNTPMLTWSHAATPTDICTRTAPRACKKSVAVEILIGSYWGHVYLQTHEMLVNKSRSLTTLFQHPNISSLIVIAGVITGRMI